MMMKFMKKKSMETAEQKRYRHRLLLKKIILYFVWILTAVAVGFAAFLIFKKDCNKRIRPQINRAIIQVARLLPEVKENELALRETYDQMVKSWEELLNSDEFSIKGELQINEAETSFEDLVGSTLSWMNRVTDFKVGRDGLVAVVSKDSHLIAAHPDKELVGGKFAVIDESEKGNSNVVSIDSINGADSEDDVNIRFNLMIPLGKSTEETDFLDKIGQAYKQAIYGGILSYGDYYIVCGIPASEYLSSVLGMAAWVAFIYLLLMWILIKWICLEMDARRETAKSMRKKLFSYGAVLCVVFFCITCYMQIVTNVANNMKTMAKDADVAVDTLEGYENQKKELDDFLDSIYLTQCRIASYLISNDGAKDLTWQDMERYAEALKVKYVYLFDKNGEVVVTNAPYDTFRISEDPEDFSYEFRRVLDGVDHVVLAPMQDKWRDENIQYIAVNVRDENNLTSGFVLIGVDPRLRDLLHSPLKVDTVLQNLVIGLPDDAIAIDKETLKIAGTTGIGYIGGSAEELGITSEMLIDDLSGFFEINGKEYYAGVAESSAYYMVPLMLRTGNLGAIVISLKLMLAVLVSSIIVICVTLIRYQHVVIDSAPVVEIAPEEEPADPEPGKDEAEDEKSSWIFSGFSSILQKEQKKDLEDRWRMNDIPKDQMTPEKRVSRIIYWVVTVFCLLVLLPILFEGVKGQAHSHNLNNLAYVISGNWQKGFNFFAFTSCLFMLCALYVIVVFLNQILYRIAKVSSMRVETVCLLIKNTIKYACVIVFVYYALSQVGVDTKTLLASAGILSMMVSFGAKDLVGDIIAGFFTLVEGTYKVGDFITVGSWSGTVVEIGLRTTKVRSFADTKVISNSAIREVINCSGEVARMVLKAPISYETDLKRVEDVLDEELPKLMDVIPGLVKPPKYEGVDSLEDSKIFLRITIYVENSAKAAALRSLTREVKLLFDREGFEVPYNQLVLHNEKDPEPARAVAGEDTGNEKNC